jgi:CRISPR system Cascade subunit CasB
MPNDITARVRRIIHPEAQKALLEWFAVLSERYIDKDAHKINGRAWRAELKRMAPPYGVMMCEGYVDLRQRITRHMLLEPVHEMALALFVSVAAHVKSHKQTLSFAAQLGEKLHGDRPCLSRLRFERLQKATDPETFCNLLISAVKIRGTEGVNIISLADSIFLWMEEWLRREEHQPEASHPFDRNRIRWANEYLSTARTK